MVSLSDLYVLSYNWACSPADRVELEDLNHYSQWEDTGASCCLIIEVLTAALLNELKGSDKPQVNCSKMRLLF